MYLFEEGSLLPDDLQCEEPLHVSESTLSVTTGGQWVHDHLGRPVGEVRVRRPAQLIYLSYEEVCALAAQFREVRGQLEWSMATWLSVAQPGSKTEHLVKKTAYTEGTPAVQAVCGYRPTEPWTWTRVEPLVGEPGTMSICKRCLSRYHLSTAACSS